MVLEELQYGAKMTIIKDALQDIADLLEDEESWTKGTFARNSADMTCSVDDADAQCWCVMGALMRTALKRNLSTQQCRDVVSFLQVACRANGGLPFGVAKYNDVHTHDEVMTMLNYAVEHTK